MNVRNNMCLDRHVPISDDAFRRSPLGGALHELLRANAQQQKIAQRSVCSVVVL